MPHHLQDQGPFQPLPRQAALPLPPAYNENNTKQDESQLRHRFDKEPSSKRQTVRTVSTSSSKAAQYKLPKETLKHIDYVLIYPNKSLDEVEPNSSSYRDLKKKIDMRKKFESAMAEETLETQTDVIGDDVYVKIHTPLFRLCQEAEHMNLEMPLLGMQNYPDNQGCFGRLEDRLFKTDDEIDFVSAPFDLDQMHKFANHDDADEFFKPALRCLLTHYILINIDIRNEMEESEDPFAKKGLPYLKLKKVYTDSFILHDETLNDPSLEDDLKNYKAKLGSQFILDTTDTLPTPESLLTDKRHELNLSWAKRWFKYQPLWKIRNYFGEKIALYFAWSGALIVSLWIPTLLGLCIFFYGLNLSIRRQLNANATTFDNETGFIQDVTVTVENSINVLKESFDNEVTPYFAVIICLWGTLFLEYWKRRNATLAYEWDVNSFEDAEPDRPEFYGTSTRVNPVIPDELEWIYPIYRQIAKYALSFSVLIVMVFCVFICTASVVLYRVYMSVNYCTAGMSAGECLVVATLISSVLQAITIMILGKIYDKVAVILTDWENHRTMTQYNDALIIKLFAFQFANSYTSLFYIAFFRGIDYNKGIFGLGVQYQDSCGTSGNCMAMLSLQVLVLMLAKPAPKFLKDVVLPFVLKLWRRYIRPCLGRVCSCCKCCTKVSPEKSSDEIQAKIDHYMYREKQKPDLKDFTLGEYTEKIIVYGFLMLFSASLPLAPFIALLVNWLDMRIDARRMLWWYRRPTAFIAQDIGMWYGILQFLNMAGVVTNAFLIAFTSAWGSKYTTTEKLWIVIGFEHIVLVLKFALQAIVPDVPKIVRLSIRREKYQVSRILADKTDNRPRAGQSSMKPKSAELRINKDTLYSNVSSLPPLSIAPSKTDTTVMQVNDETDQNTPKKSHKKHKKKHRKSRGEAILTDENSVPNDMELETDNAHTTDHSPQHHHDYSQQPDESGTTKKSRKKLVPLRRKPFSSSDLTLSGVLLNNNPAANTDDSGLDNKPFLRITSANKAKRNLAAKYGTLKYNQDGSQSFGFGDKFPGQRDINLNSENSTTLNGDHRQLVYFPPNYPRF